MPLLWNNWRLLAFTRWFLQFFLLIQLRAAVFLSTAGLYVGLGFLATGGALLPSGAILVIANYEIIAMSDGKKRFEPV